MDTSRPIEPLIGDNRGIVRQRLGNIHCMTPLSEALRLCRPKNMRSLPPELRRGWVQCVVETLDEYRSLYVDVVTGNVGRE